jgi:hypothetical protein
MLADEAARLIPEPPASHDAFGYLAWEELVVTTARRLSLIAGTDECSTAAITLTLRSGRLDGRALLTLATLLTDPSDSQAGERALWEAVAHTRPMPELTGGIIANQGRTNATGVDRSSVRPITRRAQRRLTLVAPVRN